MLFAFNTFVKFIQLEYLPVVLCRKVLVVNSAMPENDVMYAWACVPFTGILKSLPANTFDVPSKPPADKTHRRMHVII